MNLGCLPLLAGMIIGGLIGSQMGLAAFGGAVNASWVFAPLGAFLAWSIYMLAFVEGDNSVLWKWFDAVSDWLDEMLEKSEEQKAARATSEQEETAEKQRIKARVKELRDDVIAARFKTEATKHQFTVRFWKVFRRLLLVFFAVGFVVALIQIRLISPELKRYVDDQWVVVFYGVACFVVAALIAMFITREQKANYELEKSRLMRLENEVYESQHGFTFRTLRKAKNNIAPLIGLSLLVWYLLTMMVGKNERDALIETYNSDRKSVPSKIVSKQEYNPIPALTKDECDRARSYAKVLKNSHLKVGTSELSDLNYMHWAGIVKRCEDRRY